MSVNPSHLSCYVAFFCLNFLIKRKNKSLLKIIGLYSSINFLFKIQNKCLTWISASLTECSEEKSSSSNGKPVILWGPFGIRRTVNLNWATCSPVKKKKNHEINTILTFRFDRKIKKDSNKFSENELADLNNCQFNKLYSK